MTRLTDTEQWEILIEEMGYMAQLRNLRNFDKANINSALRNKVSQRLSNPVEVARSKQLPFRFYSAWQNVKDQRWLPPLEKALTLSVPNIPALPGRSLILIDTSGSMQAEMSTQKEREAAYRRARVMNVNTGEVEDDISKKPRRVDAAALFAIALAIRNAGQVDVYGFADGQMAVNNLVNSGKSILQVTDLFGKQIGAVGHGTQIERAVRDTYNGQDRVFIFTDMQTVAAETISGYDPHGDITRAVPKDKHVYGFDLSGYEHSAMNQTPYRHEMGGLTDHTFGAVPQIESGAAGKWPWEK